MNKKAFITLGVIFAGIIIIIVAVKHSSPKNDQSLTIGLILPMTDFAASYGEKALAGAKAAVGSRSDIRLIVEDEKCATKPALNAYQKLTQIDHIDLLVGPLCGSPQEAVAPLVKSNPIPVFLPAAASEGLATESGHAMFNTQYSLENEGKVIADRMTADAHKNVVIIGYKNAFSESEINGFKKAFPGNIVKEIWFTDNTSDIRTELAKLKRQSIDAIFSSDIAFYFAKGRAVLDQYGIHAPIYSPYPTEDSSVQPLAEGTIYSYPGDIVGDQGATYGLTYDAVTKAMAIAAACHSDKTCMISKLRADDSFDSNGTSKRPIIFKKVVNGEGVVIK